LPSWTEKDDAFLIANLDKPTPYLAKKLGRTIQAIHNRVWRLRKKGLIKVKNRIIELDPYNYKSKRMFKNCEYCGKQFRVFPSISHRRFCSDKCARAWRRGRKSTEIFDEEWHKKQRIKHLEQMKPRVTKVCEWCGKKFQIRLYEALRGQGRFCSRKCQMLWMNRVRNVQPDAIEKRAKRMRGKTYEELYGKEKSKEIKQKIAEWTKRHIAKRALEMKGKTIEEIYGFEKAQEIRRKMIGRFKGEKNPMFGKVVYPKPYFSEFLGHKVRSSWEEEVCKLLKLNGIEYEYEPKAFVLKISGDWFTYTPDLKISDSVFIEVKGALYDWQLKKMRAFVKLYGKTLILVGADRYKLNGEPFVWIPYSQKERVIEVLKETLKVVQKS